MMKDPNSPWFVYILRCRDHSLYTGITTDPQRRLNEHNSEKTGARYTRGRRPVFMVYLEPFPSRSAAARQEHIIKKMSLSRKNLLVQGQQGNPPAEEISPKGTVACWNYSFDDVS